MAEDGLSSGGHRSFEGDRFLGHRFLSHRYWSVMGVSLKKSLSLTLLAAVVGWLERLSATPNRQDYSSKLVH